ncbi:MAG TPA: response regulator [Pyrinomonadaceae bacterium]|jgi:CheY-like chemotaxis protein|nr:response regulator [Pyrinomonadaceae bacterium]
MLPERCRVLIIDDHEDTSEILTILLGEEDYDVAFAATIQEALQLVTTQKFDLYVLDKHLPDGSGLELCTKLNEVTPGIPCIFYTGDAYDIHRIEAMAAGADAYVAKPDIDGLIEKVSQLLAKEKCASATS